MSTITLRLIIEGKGEASYVGASLTEWKEATDTTGTIPEGWTWCDAPVPDTDIKKWNASSPITWDELDAKIEEGDTVTVKANAHRDGGVSQGDLDDVSDLALILANALTN